MSVASLLRLVVAMSLGLAAASFAEDAPATIPGSAPDSILKPWADAVEKYEKSRETATAVLVRSLESAEEKARATGDLEKVKAITRERTLLLEKGTLPTSVKTATFEKSMDTAKTVLRAAAQKTKTALVRQKYDDQVASIEEQLTSLLGPGKPKGETVAAGLPNDGRTFWKHKEGTEFRMIKSKEWVEALRNGSRTRHQWTEVARTPEYVELYDKDRKFGMRLRERNAEVAYDYDKQKREGFGGWANGEWVIDRPDVVYLSNLTEKAKKVWHYLDREDFGWGKNGQLMVPEAEFIFLDNSPSPKGIFTHPAPNDFAMVRYDIGKLKKQIFRAKFGIADLRSKNLSSKLTFVVIGDGEKLFTSKPIQNWGVAHECEINVRTVKELELRVECDGDATDALAVWYEPRLSVN